MKQITLITLFIIISKFTLYPQEHFIETFDANSFEWTEAPKGFAGPSAIIEEGFMKVQLSGNFFASQEQFIETHCYAPINIEKPFTIKTNVLIKSLPITGICGLIFNYKDDGNYYIFKITYTGLGFGRYVDGKLVGSIVRPMTWTKYKDIAQEWILISDNQTLRFLINGEPMLNVRYMPLQYTGVGFYAFGKGQKIFIDDIEFIQ